MLNFNVEAAEKAVSDEVVTTIEVTKTEPETPAPKKTRKRKPKVETPVEITEVEDIPDDIEVSETKAEVETKAETPAEPPVEVETKTEPLVETEKVETEVEQPETDAETEVETKETETPEESPEGYSKVVKCVSFLNHPDGEFKDTPFIVREAQLYNALPRKDGTRDTSLKLTVSDATGEAEMFVTKNIPLPKVSAPAVALISGHFERGTAYVDKMVIPFSGVDRVLLIRRISQEEKKYCGDVLNTATDSVDERYKKIIRIACWRAGDLSNYPTVSDPVEGSALKYAAGITSIVSGYVDFFSEMGMSVNRDILLTAAILASAASTTEWEITDAGCVRKPDAFINGHYFNLHSVIIGAASNSKTVLGEEETLILTDCIHAICGEEVHTLEGTVLAAAVKAYEDIELHNKTLQTAKEKGVKGRIEDVSGTLIYVPN